MLTFLGAKGLEPSCNGTVAGDIYEFAGFMNQTIVHVWKKQLD
jgi:hypothetical protein